MVFVVVDGVYRTVFCNRFSSVITIVLVVQLFVFAGGEGGSVAVVSSTGGGDFRYRMYNSFWNVITFVVAVNFFVFVCGEGSSVAIVVSGGGGGGGGQGGGSGFSCGLCNRGLRLSRICLYIIRGRHNWIDGDETQGFGRILISKTKKCSQVTCFFWVSILSASWVSSANLMDVCDFFFFF